MSSAYIPGIDRLRAVAALSVVLAHVVGPSMPGFSKYLFTGYPAVIAFFVISGFCIHVPYVSAPLPVRGFLLARLVRIMVPVAVAMPLAYLLGMKQFNPVDGYILWSVVCECVYYALYPLFLMAHRRGLPFAMQWKLALPLCLGLAVWLGSDHYGSANNFGPALNWLVALPSWLIGCALAERRHGGPVVPLRIAVAGTASLMYWATMNTPAGFYLTGNLFAILCAAWISAEIASAQRVNWLDRMGKWSYSTYLFHAIVWTAVERVFTARPVFYLPFILLGCYGLYRLVEKPSHGWARRLYRQATGGALNEKSPPAVRPAG